MATTLTELKSLCSENGRNCPGLVQRSAGLLFSLWPVLVRDPPVLITAENVPQK